MCAWVFFSHAAISRMEGRVVPAARIDVVVVPEPESPLRVAQGLTVIDGKGTPAGEPVPLRQHALPCGLLLRECPGSTSPRG